MSSSDREKKLDAVEKILGMTYRGIDPQPMPKGWEKAVLTEVKKQPADDSTPFGDDHAGEQSPEPEAGSGHEIRGELQAPPHRLAWVVPTAWGAILAVTAVGVVLGMIKTFSQLETVFLLFPDPALLRRLLGL